ILNENTAVLMNINVILFLTNCANNIVIAKETAVRKTPKTISTFVGDKIKLEMNTPSIIHQNYLLLNTIKWLISSENRICTFKKPKGATIAVTAKYSAAISALITNVLILICNSLLSFLSWDGFEPRLTNTYKSSVEGINYIICVENV